MSIQAKVTSTDALESFRASLIVFLGKAKRAVDDASDEVRRTRQWLQHDQRTLLESEMRRKQKQLDQAQAELMSAKLGATVNQQSALMNRQMAVARLQREIAEMQGKLRKVKGWTQNYDTATEPVLKRVEKLRQSLDELPKAISYLVSVQKVLEDYADSAGSAGALPPETLPRTEIGTGPEVETS